MEWHVEKEKLKEIQDAKVKDYFICPNTFRSDQISWQLLIYPNGFCENECGNCNIFLVANCKLNHQGTKIKYHLKCDYEPDIEWSDYAYFHHKNTNHQLMNKLYRNQLLKMNELTFKCDIDIIPPKQRKQNDDEHHHQYNNTQCHNNLYIADKTNSSYIVWDFNHSEIQNLIKMTVGSFSKSPEFVLHDLQWKVRCYPNGNTCYAGDFTLYLDLIQIPTQIYSLHAVISLYIPQTNTKYYKQYAFNKYHKNYNNDNMRIFNDRDSCLLIPSGYLPIQSLFTLNTLNIMLSIDIRRINFSLSAETTMGKTRLLNTIKISNHISYEWKISKQQLQEFKNSKMKQMWASDKFEMWYLVFSPNGNNMHNKGKSILSLCLLELPHSLGAITAKIRLKCMEYEWIHTAAFRYRPNGRESGFSSWPDDTLSFMQFSQFNEENISFLCDIDIIAMYDRNGYEVTNEQYKVTLSNKKINRLKSFNISDDEHSLDEKDEKEEILIDDKKTNQYETPGYIDDDTTNNDEFMMKDINNENTKLLKKEINELRDELSIAMIKINKLEKKVVNIMNNNNNNNNNNMNNNGNDNHIESFEKWYKYNIQLPQYYDLFIQGGFDSLLAVSGLTDTDLSDLGIAKKGHRIKILKTIENLIHINP